MTRSLSRSWAASHDFLAFLQEIEFFPYRLQIGQSLWERNKENRVVFAQVRQEKLKETTNLLQCFVISDECSFSLHGPVNNQNCRIWDFQRLETVYELPRSSPTLVVWCTNFKNGGDRALGIWQQYCYWRRIEHDDTVLSFLHAI